MPSSRSSRPFTRRVGNWPRRARSRPTTSRNSDFHHCIYQATHNAFLAQEASRLHAMLQPYRRMQLQVRNRMARSFAEHDAVVAAIRAGDPEAAAEAMRDHVVIQGDRFHDLLAAMRQDVRRAPDGSA